LIGNASNTFTRLDAKRREQTPQALARLVISSLFVGLWAIFWVARVPMPLPFLIALLLEIAFFVIYWRIVFILPNVRSVSLAQYGMLAIEIVFHTTMVYFLGSLSWLGSFAYVFGLIFTNAFLDLRKGLVYTTGACAAFSALILLEATGAVPHYEYLAQGPLRYSDPRFVATTLVCATGVFYSIYLWSSWVGQQLRRERDAAIRAQDELLDARVELQRANEELEQRVRARTVELEMANAALRDSEARVRTVITNAPIVLFALDKDGAFTLLEGKALEAMDVEPELVVGRSAFEVYTNAPTVIEAINHAFDGERSTTLAPGGASLFEAQLEPMHDDRGNIIGVIGVATDITERNHAENALRESEERLRLLVEGVDVIVWEADATTWQFSFVSPQAETIVGYPIKQWTTEPDFWVHHIHPDDREWTVSFCSAETAQGQDHEFDYRMIAMDGRVVWLRDIVRVVTDSQGKASQLRGIMIDITERKRTEDALRDSEERFRKIFEEGPLGMAIVGRDVKPIRANATLCQMLGYTEEELSQLSFSEITHPDYADRDSALAQKLFAGEIPSFKVEKRYIKKNGEILPVMLVASAMRDREGAITHSLGMMEDISERKRAEEALRESEETLRSTIESTADGILVVNNTGGVIYANKRFASLWRIPAELLATRDDDKLLEFVLSQVQEPEAFLSKVRELYESSREDLDTLDFRDGRAFERYSRPLMLDEHVAGRVWSFRDVTERKRAERTLAEQARLDPLTGLLNRRAGLATINERLASAKREGGRLAVFMLDLDRFKSINDSYSHEMGDTALIRVAEVLTKLFGERGVICRLGGDEFEIAVAGIEIDDAIDLGEQLRAALHRSLTSDKLERLPTFTASIGVACYPEDGDTAVELGRRADEAMYAGKAAGADTVRVWRNLKRDRAA